LNAAPALRVSGYTAQRERTTYLTMNSRTPLLMFAIALPFTGCTCEWHASTSKSWSTNSGGERVVIVQEDPYQAERERQARIAREREWERERDRERSRRPVVINAGGRTGTGAAPHAPAINQPAPTPVQPGPSRGGASGGGYSGGGYSGGSFGNASGSATPVAPIAQPSPAPVPVAPPPAPVVAPPPAPPPSDTYVAPREINKPSGGPSRAANPGGESNSGDKNKPTRARSGRMTRQQ
jgi:hypothetical protein